jgi:hypothetical protein
MVACNKCKETKAAVSEPALYRYTWAWGEEGFACETHRLELQQFADQQLRREISFTPLLTERTTKPDDHPPAGSGWHGPTFPEGGDVQTSVMEGTKRSETRSADELAGGRSPAPLVEHIHRGKPSDAAIAADPKHPKGTKH